MRSARARRGIATPIPTPIPMPVQSLFAPSWGVAAVVDVVSVVVDVLVVDSSVLLSVVVVSTGLAFVVIDESVDDELDGDELGEFDDEDDDCVENVDDKLELEVAEEEEVEVVEEPVSELVEEVAAAATVTAAPKSQSLARNNELLLPQHCAPSSSQQ
jgi:hypothetical protein